MSISAVDARKILNEMGYNIPSKITNGVSDFLRNAPSLSDNEIQKFIKLAGGM